MSKREKGRVERSVAKTRLTINAIDAGVYASRSKLGLRIWRYRLEQKLLEELGLLRAVTV